MICPGSGDRARHAIERFVFLCHRCEQPSEIHPDTIVTYEQRPDGRVTFRFTTRRVAWWLMLSTRLLPPKCRLIWFVLVNGQSVAIDPPAKLRADWSRRTITTIEKVKIHQ